MSEISMSCFHHDESRLFFLPHPALRSCIAHYTLSLAAYGNDAPDTLSLIPDASGCLIFTPYPGRLESVFWGPTTKIVVVDNGPDEPPVRIFVEFLPGGAHRLLGFPLAELCDRQVDLWELDAALAARSEQIFSDSGMHSFPDASVLPFDRLTPALFTDAEAALHAKHPADAAYAHDPSAASADWDPDIPSVCAARRSGSCEPPFRTAGMTQWLADLMRRTADLTQQTADLTRRFDGLTPWNTALSRWIAGLDQLLLSRFQEEATVSMQALLSHLHRNANRICVQDLSAYTCYSQRQLSRIFSSRLGIGVKNYLRLLKINLAAQKLPQYRGNLAALAQELGYFDQPHFIHDFKAVCGVTPTIYLSRLSDFYNETYKF
ncbi:helix-turn-helix transcriptional regulator [Candidatus Soleaferrea massiliensis]|uniref:helix-turn-helix transcriptional regulator n=1 Tax=Candidatus Soleaferrea massiliensis TaxID=1470354 RepID=UPI000694100F|nr:helix-turn-helix transcriptional regulator [Candidatus Soleaferrea massiliensis]